MVVFAFEQLVKEVSYGLYPVLAGVVAFAVALLILAAACLIAKSRSLPLLPFLVPIFAIIEFVGSTL